MKSTEANCGAPSWKILLVDDHPAILESLAHRLKQEPDFQVCAGASNGREALKAIAEHQPDLVILDLSLPDNHGLELIKDIRSQHPSVRLLIFSMHDESLYGERALRAGAQGYLMKHEPPEKVHEAVRKVLDGKMAVSEDLMQKMLGHVTGSRNGSLNPVDLLSDRELEVYQMIGMGLGTKEIAYRLGRSIKTVETHRMRIKEKLGIGSAPELIAVAASWIAESH